MENKLGTTLTYVLSFVALVGLRQSGGITNWPAATKSESPKTFSNSQSLLPALDSVTLLAVQASPIWAN